MAGMKLRLARREKRLRLKAGVGGNLARTMPLDSICRTAVYVIRMHGGVGGGGREVFPYPD